MSEDAKEKKAGDENNSLAAEYRGIIKKIKETQGDLSALTRARHRSNLFKLILLIWEPKNGIKPIPEDFYPDEMPESWADQVAFLCREALSADPATPPPRYNIENHLMALIGEKNAEAKPEDLQLLDRLQEYWLSLSKSPESTKYARWFFSDDGRETASRFLSRMLELRLTMSIEREHARTAWAASASHDAAQLLPPELHPLILASLHDDPLTKAQKAILEHVKAVIDYQLEKTRNEGGIKNDTLLTLITQTLRAKTKDDFAALIAYSRQLDKALLRHDARLELANLLEKLPLEEKESSEIKAARAAGEKANAVSKLLMKNTFSAVKPLLSKVSESFDNESIALMDLVAKVSSINQPEDLPELIQFVSQRRGDLGEELASQLITACKTTQAAATRTSGSEEAEDEPPTAPRVEGMFGASTAERKEEKKPAPSATIPQEVLDKLNGFITRLREYFPEGGEAPEEFTGEATTDCEEIIRGLEALVKEHASNPAIHDWFRQQKKFLDVVTSYAYPEDAEAAFDYPWKMQPPAPAPRK